MKEESVKLFMKTSIAVLLTFALASVAQAREIVTMSYQELYDKADLVIIAKPLATQDTTEQTVLPGIGPALHVVGVSSELDISVVMKGQQGLKKCVLHHYRLANPQQPLKNGPMLVSFDPKQDNRFLLFLRRETDGRYAPVAGQTDPATISVVKIEGVAR